MIRSSILVVPLLLLTSICYAQLSVDCLRFDKSGLYNKAFHSFESDLFEYYNYEKDSIKAYRTFLTEIANLSLDLRKFPSNSSIKLARVFKKKSNDHNSIWVKLSTYENNKKPKKTKPSKANPTKKGEEEILIFNYRGGFIQCLKNNSNSDAFQKIIKTLEKNGNISTALIAQKLNYIPDKKFTSSKIKKFIAFDIYFSILMVIEKAFSK